MYTIADSLYHKVLRVSALTLALVLLFVSGILNDKTSTLANIATNQMANVVGVSVGVTPTELNTMTAEFTAWQRELAAREAALVEREIAIGLNTNESPPQDWSTFILATILFILLLLILLNYALDYVRRQSPVSELAVQ